MRALQTELDGIVTAVVESLLQAPVQADDPFQLEARRGRILGGVVAITGGWDGLVGVQCGEALARRATAAMLGVDAAAASIADLQDAIGELANMVGGNVKALLPGSCRLGLPVVVEGTDFRMRLPGSTQILQCAYRVDGEPLSVSVLRRQAGEGPPDRD